MEKETKKLPFDIFDDLSKQIIPHWTPSLTSVPDILYHYTDASGLLGMIQNNEIWATDSRYLNDRTELIYAEQLALELVTQHSKSPRYRRSSDFLAKCIESIGNYGVEDSSCLFCMSAHPDSLSQWRGYAQEGMGFTIGFDGKALCRAAGLKSGFSLEKVEYDLDVQTATIVTLINQFDEMIESIGEESCVDDAVFHFVWAIYRLTYIYKHRSFKSEDEWRLVTILTINDEDKHKPENSIIDDFDGMLIRSRGNELVPYSILKPHLAKTARLMIKTVGVGPGFPSNNQGLAAEYLLKKYKHKATIYFADTPFRRS